MRFPVIACLTFLLSVPFAVQAELSPRNLRCERLVQPLDVDSLAPRLSWVATSKSRGESQSAYQVLVATSTSALRSNRPDMWNSGKQASSENAHIVYRGTPLRSATRYYWKVRLWNQNGKGFDSPVSFWEMGLLSAKDWSGHWIGKTTETKYTPAPLLRKGFSLSANVKKARLYLTGLGYFEARINGKKAGTGHLEPGYTRFDRRVLYCVYDVTSLLKEGDNALGVMLGTGWYNTHTDAVWNFHHAPWRAAPKALCELRVELENGEQVRVGSDETWRTTTGPIVFDSIYSGESYDARLEKTGWDTAAYDASAWESAKLVPPPAGTLKAQQMPPIRITKTLPCVKITEPKPGVYLFDMGQNLAGHALLKVQGRAGETITLRYAENLNPNGTLDASNLNMHVRKVGDAPPRFQTDTYTLKGEGVETWEARFVYHGFQYVEATGFSQKPTKATLQARFVHSDVAPAGTFACSNTLFNRIWEAGRWSYLSNLHSIPTDCPHREKNGWTGDAHLAAEQALLNFDPGTVYAKWVADLDDEMRETGELPGIVPSGGWGYDWGNGPAWDSAFLLIPWYMYEYLGDTRILEQHYPKMKRYVDYLTRRAQEGIVSIGLGDWAPYKTETPVEVTSTAYYYRDTRIVAESAALLGKAEEARRYTELAAEIKRAFLTKFCDTKTGRVANDSQTALACALYQGLTTPESHALTLERLVAKVAETNGHIDTGILGAKYLLNTLLENDRTDVAYRVTSQKDLPSWGYWLEQGATTLWEQWSGAESRNHIMYGDILAWFTKAIAGIQLDPAHPGFSHFVVKPPLLRGVSSAKATYASVRGDIAVEWLREGKQFDLRVSVPVHATATVYVPAKSAEAILEGGKALSAVPQVRFVRMQGGYVVLEVSSGDYRFVSNGDFKLQ